MREYGVNFFMKKVISVILTLILALSMIISLQSCRSAELFSEPPALDEVRERFIYLIEESKELNTVLFGDGLPVYEDGEALTERKMVYYNNNMGDYYLVNEKSQFLTVDSIKMSVEKIYSSEYSADIYESAFDGVITGAASAYVRFYDNGNKLCQNKNATVFKITERIYDYSSMTMVEPSSGDYVNIEIDSYTVDDPTVQRLKLSFIFQNNNWYLDSPSY